MAIALDTSTDLGSVSAASLTAAHVCTGSNLALYVAVNADSDIITGVTYNGVAMTQLVKNTGGTNTGILYIYGLANPSTGSNNVVISASASTGIRGIAISYTGAAQSGLPDASATNNLNGVGSGTWTGIDITSIADNCWALQFTIKTFTEVPNATSGCVNRVVGAGYGLYDTNSLKTPAGSISMRCAHTGGSQNYSHVGVTIAPVTTVVAGITSGFMTTNTKFWGM